MNTRLALLAASLGLFAAPSSQAAETLWSLRPLRRPPVPAVTNAAWVRTPIDAFILARLESSGLAPAPEAGRRALLRRATLDMTGLPPSPEETDRFEADTRPGAYERAIEALLGSPRYGERWARHWLDVAHFAETHGHDQDRIRTNAWPYRDYVIASFNAGKPYARFVEEQIAGDVLYPHDPQAVVATGFLAAGPWDESSMRDIREDSIDREIARYLDRDDIVTTVMQTFASTTAHCARCHDHKFDPISQREYYGLQAVFAATDKANRDYDPDPSLHRERRRLMSRLRALERGGPDTLEPLSHPSAQHAWREWAAAQSAALSDGAGAPPEIGELLMRPADSWTEADERTLARHYDATETRRALEALPPSQQVYAGTSEFAADGSFKPASEPRTIHVLARGDILQPGGVAAPGALGVFAGQVRPFAAGVEAADGERRAALARWLTDPSNGLTWRSIANRVWHYHFGRGLTTTPNDFGAMGQPPSHPELLDWLAAWLRDQDGSLKDLHRLILTSSVYRQSSDRTPASAQDPDNRWFSRMNRRRLDAEQIRDGILQASGQLDLRMGGPSARHFQLSPGIHVTPVVDYEAFAASDPSGRRRAIYRFLFRTLPDPMMDTLDCPDPSQSTPVRAESTTALQALTLLHHPFVIEQSRQLAQTAGAEADGEDGRVSGVFRRILGRAPTSEEREDAAAYAARHGLANLARMLFNSNEFIFAP